MSLPSLSTSELIVPRINLDKAALATIRERMIQSGGRALGPDDCDLADLCSHCDADSFDEEVDKDIVQQCSNLDNW